MRYADEDDVEPEEIARREALRVANPARWQGEELERSSQRTREAYEAERAARAAEADWKAWEAQENRRLKAVHEASRPMYQSLLQRDEWDRRNPAPQAYRPGLPGSTLAFVEMLGTMLVFYRMGLLAASVAAIGCGMLFGSFHRNQRAHAVASIVFPPIVALAATRLYWLYDPFPGRFTIAFFTLLLLLVLFGWHWHHLPGWNDRAGIPLTRAKEARNVNFSRRLRIAMVITAVLWVLAVFLLPLERYQSIAG